MILAQPTCPLREAALDLVQDHKPLIQLDSVPLAIVEGNRLDPCKSL